jgi:hypothetical protein
MTVKTKTIMDYFSDEVEYPSEIAFNILPMNTWWNKVSSTFVNGFINYVKPIKAYVLDRYEADKTEAIKNIKDEFHTDLSCFYDDVILLAKIESDDETLNRFMLFWFDMDVSDCGIGRFETTDNDQQVLESLTNWLDELKKDNAGKTFNPNYDNGVLNYHPLPLSFLTGWISF